MIVLTEPDADPLVRVRALESGADDVVPRDVYLELRARLRSLLRRTVLGQADVVEAGPLVVDRRSRQVRVGGTAVRLAGREFELAAKLASDPHRVFTKTELLRRLGDPDDRARPTSSISGGWTGGERRWGRMAGSGMNPHFRSLEPMAA